MNIRTLTSKRGVTLIELLIALVICGMIVAGIYRVFIAQTRAYTVQDQVSEVQQTVRSSMELVLRDLRMISYDGDENPAVVGIGVPDPPIVPGFNGAESIRIFYQYNNTLRQVDYWRDANSNLNRQQTSTPADPSDSPAEVLLANVDAFTLTYGVDGTEGLTETQDGSIDDTNVPNGTLDSGDFVPNATVGAIGSRKVIAVRVVLTARPAQDNPDVRTMVSARTLSSIVTLRNRCLIK